VKLAAGNRPELETFASPVCVVPRSLIARSCESVYPHSFSWFGLRHRSSLVFQLIVCKMLVLLNLNSPLIRDSEPNEIFVKLR
jgi:hypothetical protein